jgi:PilZ domain
MTSESVAKKRQAARDSLFLSADVRVDGAAQSVTVRVRNLSSGGMMIDANSAFRTGSLLVADLRGIGEITGSIAWLAEGRAGVAFDREIDPQLARMPATAPKARVIFEPVIDKSRRPGLKLR